MHGGRGEETAASQNEMRNYCSCPPKLTFMPQASAQIPMCCGGVGQGAAPPVIPDFSPLYENSPGCLGSSEPFFPSALSPPPLLSPDLPGLCWVGPGIYAAPPKKSNNHQATFLTRRNAFTSKPSKPNSKTPGKAGLSEQARQTAQSRQWVPAPPNPMHRKGGHSP